MGSTIPAETVGTVNTALVAEEGNEDRLGTLEKVCGVGALDLIVALLGRGLLSFFHPFAFPTLSIRVYEAAGLLFQILTLLT